MRRQRLLRVEVGLHRLCLLPGPFQLLELSLEEGSRCHLLRREVVEVRRFLALLLERQFPFRPVGLVEEQPRCLERGLVVREQFRGGLVVPVCLQDQREVHLLFQLCPLVPLDQDLHPAVGVYEAQDWKSKY